MRRALLLSGGIYHPFEETSAVVAGWLEQRGLAVTVTQDIEGGLARLAAQPHALLVVNALRWSMVQHEKYEPFRAEWALEVSPEGQAAIEAHAARGGAILGLHTASICFDTWPRWADLLGVGWRWGTSFHPPLGPVAVDGWSDPLEDEVYHAMDAAPDMAPTLWARTLPDGAPQPVSWISTERPVGYSALGHSAASLAHPDHAAHLAQLIDTLLERAS